MVVETVRMSSKGQVVIPQDVREELNAGSGTVFAIVGTRDTVVLKKISTPSKEELISDLEAIGREGKRRLQKKGFKESDIVGLVHKIRAK